MAKFHKKASLIFLTAFTTASSVLQAVPVAIYAEETGEDANWLTPVNVTWTGNIYGSHTVDLAFDRVMQTGDNGFHSNGDALGRELTADLGAVYQLDKLEYYPRDDAGNGTMTKGDIAWSIDGINWQEQSVTWEGSSAAKTIEINACARYVRMIPREAVGDFFGATEIKIFKQNGTENTPSGTVNGAPYSQDTVALVKANLGLTAAENETNSVFSPFGALDVNYNGRLDVTDYAGLIRVINNSPALAASGNLYYKADRTVVESGDELTVTVMTEDANNVSAMGGLFTFNADDFDLVAAEGQNPVQMTEWAGYMQNWSSASAEDGKTTINLAFVMEKDGVTYSGSHPIAQFTLRAKKTSKILTEEGSSSDLNIAQPLSRIGMDGNSADFTKCVFTSLPVGDKATAVLRQSDFAITITKEGTQYATDDGNNVNVMVHQRNYDGLFNGDKGDRRFELMWASGGDPYNETIHKTPVDLHFALNTPQPLKSFVLYGGNQNEDGCVRKIGATVTFDDDSVYEFDGGIFDKPDTVFTFEIPSSMWSKNVKNIDLHIKQTRRSGVDGATIDQHLTLTEFEANAFANTEEVESIELTSNPASLKRGEAAPVTASVNPDSISHRGYTLTSSDPAVADVYYVTSEDGTISWNVEGVNAGTATITVTSTSNPDIHAEFEVTVSSERVADQVLQEALDHLRALDPNLIQAERKAEVDEILNTPIPENDAEFSKFLQSVLPVAADYLYRAPIENLLINKSADSGVTVESCIHNAALNQEGGTSGPAEKTLDKDSNTYYHSNYDSEANKRMPHWILYDLGDEYDLSDVTFLPRQHGNIGSINGDVITAEIYASTDKDSLERIGEFTFEKYEDGVHIANRTEYHAMTFTPVRARYVKLNVLHTGGAGGTDMYTSIAEVNFYQPTDKSSLKSAIAERDTLTESDYTQESWEAYVQAVTDGQTTVDTPTATQEEVDGAAAEINAKKDQLEREFTLTFQQDGEIKHTARLGENCTDEELAAVKEAAKNALTIEDGYVFVRWDTEPAKPTDDAVYNAVIKADTAALEDAIEVYEALENPEAIYTADSFASYTDAIETARELVNNGTESKEAVDSALAAIQSAIDNLEVTITFIDENGSHTIDFNATASADDVKNRAPTPAEKAGYNFDKWDPEFAAPTAPATYRAQYKLDYSPLTDAIEEMKDLPQDDYTDDSWQNLQTKIAEAQSTVDNKSLNNPEEVTAKVTELTDAKNALVRTYLIKFVNVDGSTLFEKKFAKDTTADAVLAEAPEVEVETGYRFEKWVSNEDGTSPVASVTGNATYKAVVVVDKTALKAKIDAVNKELTDNSWTIDKFTDASWNALDAALKAADTAYNNSNATVQEVSGALKTLTDARNGLKNAYMVTFIVEGQTYRSIKVEEGTLTSEILPEEPKRSGYRFTGWNPSLPNTIQAPWEFKAQWELDSDDPLSAYRVAYYPFNGNADDHCADRDGVADATGVTYSNDGKSGQGVHLDAHAKISFSQDFEEMDEWTMSYWVKADTVTGNSWVTQDKTGNFVTALRVGVGGNTAGYIGFRTSKASGQHYTVTRTASPNTWYHLTWVRDSAGVTLYIDGQLVRTIPYKTFPLCLDVIGGSDFAGYVDEVRVYNKGLNADEVSVDYQKDQQEKAYVYTVTLKSELPGSECSAYKEFDVDTEASDIQAMANQFKTENSLAAEDGYVLVWKDEEGNTVSDFSKVTENKTYVLTQAVDITPLQDKVKEVQDRNLTEEPYSNESWAKFTEALHNAKAALVNIPATPAEVTALVNALQDAVDGLRAGYVITFEYTINGKKQVTTVKMEEESSAENVSKQAPSFEVPEGYFMNGWETAEGKPIEAVSKAETYIAQILVDKSQLAAKMGEVRKAIADDELTKDNFTDTSWGAIQEALNQGDQVIGDAEATVENVSAALDKLTDAWENRVSAYKISFVLEGTVISEVKVAVTDTISSKCPTAPVREGYTFDGWYTDAEYTTKLDESARPVSAQSLYGRWIAEKRTVTIHWNNGNPDDVRTVNYDSVLNLGTPVRTGHEFLGWFTDEQCTAENVWTDGSVITANLDLYANWKIEKRTVTLNQNYNGAPTPAEDVIDYSAAYTPAAPAEREGYDFAGWYKDAAGTESEKWVDGTAVTEDTELYAKWKIQKRTVTLNLNFEGAPNPAEDVIDYGTVYTPAAPERVGYDFVGWYKDAAGTEDEKWIDGTKVTNDTELYAKWKIQATTVTLNLNYEGAPDPAEDVVDYDSAYTPAVPIREGYDFVGWYKDAAGTESEKWVDGAKVTENIELYAQWKIQKRTVTLNLNYEGAPAPTQDVVDYDTTYTPAAPAAREGYDFLGWYTDTAGTENKKWVDGTKVTENTELYAQWKIQQRTVTLNLNYEDAPDPKHDVMDYGTAYTPAAPTREGYDFLGWYTDAAGTENKKWIDGTKVTENTELYAKWKVQKRVVTLNLNYEDAAEPTKDEMDYGTAYTPAAPTREGYDFLGWYTDAAGTENKKWIDGTKVTENTEL
ncbi:InlB B-repeat-containing protein, partial [Allobaculum mucilyticum]